MNRPLIRTTFAVVTSVTLACVGNDGPTVTDFEAASLGTWTLQSVNGKPLPYCRAGAGGMYDVLRSEIQLTELRRASHRHYELRALRSAGTGGRTLFRDNHDELG